MLPPVTSKDRTRKEDNQDDYSNDEESNHDVEGDSKFSTEHEINLVLSKRVVNFVG